MVCNNAFYVFGAAIANFDVISVKNTVKFMIFWKVLIYKIKKVVTNIGGYCFTKLWIEPNIISVVIYFVVCILICCLVL